MNILSRLEHAEQRLQNNGYRPGVSIISPLGAGCVLTFNLCGKPSGGVQQIISVHDSEESAESEYTRLCAKYQKRGQQEPLLIKWGR